MCHPWLAAGVTVFVAVLLVRELAPIVREPISVEARFESGLLGEHLRRWFRCRIAGLADTALRKGLTADNATLLQLAMSIVCGLSYASGWMFTAGWILIASGTLDVLDGEMARRGRRDGPRGAFLDSVVDRYGESAVFAGLVMYYRDDWVLWAVLAAWAGGFLVSYMRARAESLGIDCRAGLLQRPERFVILGGASMVSVVAMHLTCTLEGRHGLVTAAICVVAVLANLTALQRARGTLRRLP
jgi:CDP-diacylglycerol--glycerol-3-phosphate 3-phosphatidyltransferase